MRLMAAADVGGTFTDMVIYDPESRTLTLSKSPSTPDDFARGIVDCFQKSRTVLDDVASFKHGSTVAINTLIERTGARTALLTTRGFRDVLELRRGNRPNGLDLSFRTLPPLVERRHRYEVDERISGRGEVIVPLDEAAVQRLLDEFRREGIEAVAVCFLNAYLNPVHEQRVGEILRGSGLFVTLSHELSREWREYERTSTTVVNAHIGPRVAGYVDRLERRLGADGFAGRFFLMQSNGGVIPASTAKAKPVLLIESGPVAGVAGSAAIAAELGFPKVLAFDMGGTTAKCSLVEDAVPVVSSLYWVEGYARGYPIQTPVVDIIEVGTGGGSIAWIDPVGALKVGPRSAGAAPGPVCYGRGGVEPTVTDANLVLGRLNPEYFLGGEMPLDEERARNAIQSRVADRFDRSPVEMAAGIVRLANLTMSSAVRQMTIERGHDPRDFVLVAYGGAGPLHARAIADELGIPRVVIPRLPGYFSAWGMLRTDLRLDYGRTYLAALESANLDEVEAFYSEMERQADGDLRRESKDVQSVRTRRYADMRYVGQDHTVLVPIPEALGDEQSRSHILESFNRVYLQRYSHLDKAARVEIVSLRVVAEGIIPKPPIERLAAPTAETRPFERAVYYDEAGGFVQVPIYRREQLAPGATFAGPCIVEEYASTTVVHPGDRVTVDEHGLLIIDISGGSR